MATVLLLQCTCIFLATVAHVITVEVGSPTLSCTAVGGPRLGLGVRAVYAKILKGVVSVVEV